jgi:hypothetical protein
MNNPVQVARSDTQLGEVKMREGKPTPARTAIRPSRIGSPEGNNINSPGIRESPK